MSDPRKLFLIYLTALAVLLSSVAVTIVLTEMTATRLAEDAGKINVSGRQRMLSQRIAYLAQHVHTVAESTDEAKVAELEQAIDLFEASHDQLDSLPDFTALHGSRETPGSLDARIRDFIDLAREIVADPTRADALAQLKQIESQGLLDDLNAVVAAKEADSVQRVSLLQMAGRISIGVALAIIAAEIVFVFRPGQRLIERKIRDLAERNRALSDARSRLRARNMELARSNAMIRSERNRVEQAFQESERLRTEQVAFTYAVSHDLKSPANTMHLLLEELADHCDEHFDDLAHELVDQGRRTLSRMNEQVEDVLSYAMASEGRSEPERIDLSDLVAELVDALKPDIAAAGARVVKGKLAPVWGYRDQIVSLLQNLVLNALKYQAAGARAEIRISGSRLPDGTGVRIEVADNGIGIAPENHKKIFDLFQRLHLRSEYPGTGLGLSTCARIARNHDGDITVRSALGQGSVFEVTLRDQGQQQQLLGDAA